MNKEQLISLKPYCQTAIQLERLEACIEYKTAAKASEVLGCDYRRISESLAQIKNHARKSGFEVGGESFKPIIGHFVKGESALVGADGQTRMKWIKTDTNKELQLEQLHKSISQAFGDFKGSSEVQPEPEHTIDDLMVFIPIGDAHTGMLSWDEETGNNFDLAIAEDLLCTAMGRLIESAPNAGTCFIADMGDFLHRNDNKNATPASGNVLDVDGRSIKMMRIAVKILIHSVDLALKKFNKVILRNVCGNHSPEGEQMLALAMELYYHNNDRVTVESSPNKFYYHQFGKVLIGLCHGDKVKHGELPMIMAADVPKMWGDTTFHYFYIGHVHHQSTKEYQGCSVESFNTLTPNDAWHHGSGYRARKNIKLLVMHKKYGEIERITKDVSMIMGEN
jgi:hypothetical protein